MEIKPYIRKANYYETDQMGVIHHANYIRWFEEARVDFMDQMGFGYDRSVEAGVDIAVLEVACQYKTMVRFGDTVCIAVSITELTPVRMNVHYVVTDARTGELKTTGDSKHCFLQTGDHAILRLNRSIPELYELFCSLVTPLEEWK